MTKNKITTYNESSIHLQIKDHINSDKSCQEITVDRYFVDVVKDNIYYEIQTKKVTSIMRKLKYLASINKTSFVIPVYDECFLNDIDTNNIRKSPKKGYIFNFLFEINLIIDEVLINDNLSMDLYFVNASKDIIHYVKNNKNKKKIVDTKITQFNKVINIDNIDDTKFISEYLTGLNENFDFSEFKKYSKTSTMKAFYALKTLVKLGLVEQTDKIGKKIIYKRKGEI